MSRWEDATPFTGSKRKLTTQGDRPKEGPEKGESKSQELEPGLLKFSDLEKRMAWP